MANKNEENDKLHRAGISAKHKNQKQRDGVSSALQSQETKQALMDFIFGKTDENPLESVRTGSTVVPQVEAYPDEDEEQNDK